MQQQNQDFVHKYSQQKQLTELRKATELIKLLQYVAKQFIYVIEFKLYLIL